MPLQYRQRIINEIAEPIEFKIQSQENTQIWKSLISTIRTYANPKWDGTMCQE